MSYDIIFVRVGPASDRLGTARELAESEFNDETATRPSKDADERRRKLVEDLLKLDPALRYFSDDEEGYGGYIDVDDIDGRFPPIHLGVDAGMVAVTSAFGAAAVQSILPVAKVFARHGYVAYDPQRDSLLDIGEGQPSVQTRFRQGSGAVVVTDRGDLKPKPWWRFW